MSLALLLVTLLAPAASLATPTIPVVLVNHGTRQCSQVIQGDDCSWCEPPDGWEVLGQTGQATCPEGYARVDAPGMLCRGYETPFCCSAGAHRGDCEDMVIDQKATACGFVDEVVGCTLPENWQARPEGVEARVWACPPGYGWIQEEITCLQPAAGTSEPAPPAPVEDREETLRGICFGLSCLVLAALVFGLAAMFPVWYVARQKERRTRPPSAKR